MKKRALLSVSDKNGVVEFALGLSNLGFEIISTGGTAAALRQAGIDVVNVSDITGFPECLDGRVKTLHPFVHAGILARRDLAKHMSTLSELGIGTIDVVAINLYPFKETILKKDSTFEDAIENIDIGGPAMLRSAAKNHRDVYVLVDPTDYPKVLQALASKDDIKLRTELARKTFEHTAAYDALIAAYFAEKTGVKFPDKLTLTYEKQQELRYGENPHQKAAFYREPLPVAGTLSEAIQLHGKELSFNNINDSNGALAILKEFEKPCAVAVKHANPCGVGVSEGISEAFRGAYDSDPVSIFGGIVALNREVDKVCAELMSKIFLEVIMAPSYSDEAFEILTQKPNVRLLKIENISSKEPKTAHDLKNISGGLLLTDPDHALYGADELQVVTKRTPTAEEMKALTFAWTVVKHTKSNAIVLANEKRTLGVGPGQTNRIGALEIALKGAGESAAGACLASDAFFPFDDSVHAAAAAGITAIIQPGGSVRDEDSIKACDKYGIAMIFTGMRHFKH